MIQGRYWYLGNLYNLLSFWVHFQTNPKYLHTNSTSHKWPFSAVAELIGKLKIMFQCLFKFMWIGDCFHDLHDPDGTCKFPYGISLQVRCVNLPESGGINIKFYILITDGFFFFFLILLKVPGPIAADFSQTFGDFGIRRKLIFFSLPLVNFTAEKYTVWKILMKMWLVMVTIIELTQ